MENDYIKKLENWANKNLIEEEKEWFKRYHYSREKKFNFSEYFLDKISNFDEKDRRYRFYTENGNVYLDKGIISADLNLFFECFFFEIMSSLDALAHELNLLFKLYPGKDKKYNYIYFHWLFDKEKLKNNAPETYNFIKSFSETNLFGKLKYYRRILTHLTVIIKELGTKTDTLSTPTTEYLVKPLYIQQDIDKEISEENKIELTNCVKEIYENVKNFYENIYKKINVDLKIMTNN